MYDQGFRNYFLTSQVSAVDTRNNQTLSALYNKYNVDTKSTYNNG